MADRSLEMPGREASVRDHVVACLRQGRGRALFVTELRAALRKRGLDADKGEIERALAELESVWVVVVRDHYCADPHLADADLRIVGLAEAREESDGQAVALAGIDATWNEWLGEYLANHRCT